MTVIAWAQNHTGAMVGALQSGTLAEPEFWNADGTPAPTPLFPNIYVLLGAYQIGDDGSVAGYGFAPDSKTDLDYRTLVITPPLADQVTNLKAANAILSAELDADDAVIARDNLKLTNANATIVTLTARVRKDEAAIAADTKAEHGK